MGNVFEEMSMEGRMTVCNLSIEMGARGGMIAPDQKTFDFLEGRLYTKGRRMDESSGLLENIKIRSRCDFDTELNIDAADIEPMITMVQILEWELVFLKVSRMPVRFKVVQKIKNH
jgi:3-isopropylmalate/(R)-2-methylmalate dehydratase large subunit